MNEENLTPVKIVEYLDKFIIGQLNAKKSVAIALRNRWRRKRVSPEMKDEIMPKNIILIGSTGVGKTEIARRISKLVNAPFIKVEASKYTEVGYVGRDVESMVRDITEISLSNLRKEKKELFQNQAREKAVERVLDILLPPVSITPANDEDSEKNQPEQDSKTRQKFRKKILDGELDDKLLDITTEERNFSGGGIELFPMSGNDGFDNNIRDMISNFMPKKTHRKKVPLKEALKIFQNEEAEKIIDQEDLHSEAIKRVEESGIIFLDEIDKVVNRANTGRSGDVSREGVQRDLLPIVEGSTVNTRYGSVKTDHVLFIAAGAFHITKPSDLIPELQGRFPIRVELDSLSKEDFLKILTKPDNSLTKQYIQLLKTENVTLSFSDDALDELAEVACKVNEQNENIGARRLHTILETVLEDLSFNASEISDQEIRITRKYVKEKLEDVLENQDLSKYIL